MGGPLKCEASVEGSTSHTFGERSVRANVNLKLGLVPAVPPINIIVKGPARLPVP